MYILIGKKQKRSPNKRDRYYLTDVTSYEDGVIHFRILHHFIKEFIIVVAHMFFLLFFR